MSSKPLAQQILETLFNIVRIHRHCRHPADLTPGETFVLSIIHRRARERGIRVSEIASIMRVTPSGITQFVKGLVSRGLVVRSHDEEDRRVVLLRTTEQGEAIMAESMRRMIELFERIVDDLGVEESKTLLRLLSRVLRFLDTDGRANIADDNH